MSVFSFLDQQNIPYSVGRPLAELTSFKIGGPADLVIEPQSEMQCAAVLRFAREAGKKLYYLGNGTNILAPDRGCRRWILHTGRLQQLRIEGDLIEAGAGVRLVKVSSFAAKAGRTGLEFADGIPGTVGGAIFMNAGAYGGAMEQVVAETRYLDSAGGAHVLPAAEHAFGYRHSFFMEHPDYLITSTVLRCKEGDPAAIAEEINTLRRRRKEKQPLEYPSAGSTFKRPEGYFAGKLIEDAGLRGYTVGGAQVSEKHCGFIINRGGATAADVTALIEDVRAAVLRRFGVSLECEVRFLGEE